MSVLVDETTDDKEVVSVPIEKKLNLTIREAAEYSNIGMNKINEMLRNPMCSFVLYVGSKKLVKRKEFEQFLTGRMEILPKADISAAMYAILCVNSPVGD